MLDLSFPRATAIRHTHVDSVFNKVPNETHRPISSVITVVGLIPLHSIIRRARMVKITFN